jgi:hypothetical protein
MGVLDGLSSLSSGGGQQPQGQGSSTSSDSVSSPSSGGGSQSQGQVQAAPAEGSSGLQSQNPVQAATKVQAAFFVLCFISVIVGEIVYCNPDDADCVMPAYACAALIGILCLCASSVQLSGCCHKISEDSLLRKKLDGLYQSYSVYKGQDQVISDEDRQEVVEQIIEALKNKSNGSSDLIELIDSHFSYPEIEDGHRKDKIIKQEIEKRVKVLLDSCSSSRQPSSYANDEGQPYERMEEGSFDEDRQKYDYIDSLIQTIQRKNTISTLLDSPRGFVRN